MSATDAELLLVTVAAFWIGAQRPRAPALLSLCISLALIAWLTRLFLIAMYPADVAVSEDYLNGLTVWNAMAEIALITLWVLAWSCIIMTLVRFWRSVVNIR